MGFEERYGPLAVPDGFAHSAGVVFPDGGRGASAVRSRMQRPSGSRYRDHVPPPFSQSKRVCFGSCTR
ncbi:hypothetical protein GCM10017624_15260 [Azotobacter vinelandii]|nr:hypothetical protein GCM10017624_15260 [Azotobacter vinelandii]